MNAIFSHEETNTGRQRELDYLKGIFMLFIYGSSGVIVGEKHPQPQCLY